jgi:hypothetical protein
MVEEYFPEAQEHYRPGLQCAPCGTARSQGSDRERSLETQIRPREAGSGGIKLPRTPCRDLVSGLHGVIASCNLFLVRKLVTNGATDQRDTCAKNITTFSLSQGIALLRNYTSFSGKYHRRTSGNFTLTRNRFHRRRKSAGPSRKICRDRSSCIQGRGPVVKGYFASRWDGLSELRATRTLAGRSKRCVNL